MKAILIFLVLLSLAACSTAPITGPSTTTSATGIVTPVEATGIPISPTSAVGVDLQAVAFNIDAAVAANILPAGDPAQACIHDALRQAGIEAPPGVTPGQSFTPENKGVLSAGSILYIKAQQLKAGLGKQITVAVSCKALIGQFVIDGASVQNKVLDPLHLLPTLK